MKKCEFEDYESSQSFLHDLGIVSDLSDINHVNTMRFIENNIGLLCGDLTNMFQKPIISNSHTSEAIVLRTAGCLYRNNGLRKMIEKAAMPRDS